MQILFIFQFLDVFLYKTDFQGKTHGFFRPRQASTGLRIVAYVCNVAYVTNADANLSFHSSSSILCQWGNVSGADITGRLARRSSEQRHKADHYFYFVTDLSAYLASNHRGDRKGDARRASWVLMTQRTHGGTRPCLRNPSGASEDGICAFLGEKRCRPSEGFLVWANVRHPDPLDSPQVSLICLSLATQKTTQVHTRTLL